MKAQRVYLADLLERIQMVDEFTSAGRDDFFTSLKTQESVIRCFEVIGEIVKRVDPALTRKQPQVPWRQISGFRDVLIHQYNRIDLDTVWDSIEHDLPALKTATEALLADLLEDDGEDLNPSATE